MPNHYVEAWLAELEIGAELPTLPLWISPELALPLELETNLSRGVHGTANWDAGLGSFSAPLTVMQRDFAAEFIRGDSVGVGVREFGQGLGS
jgi:hypothetical protein